MVPNQQKYKNKKILITGGSGLIGSNLITRLHNVGCSLSIFHRNKNIYDIDNHTFIGDIRDITSVRDVCKNKFDIIFHCAGLSDQMLCQKNPLESFNTNVVGTINLLESVRLYSPNTRIVLLGSRSEYGFSQYLPVDELHPLNPINTYGKHKLMASQIGMIYYKTFNIPVTIIRISNVYGKHPIAGFRQVNTISYFISRAKHNMNLPIFGKGNQLRDYIYIEDVIDAILIVGKSNKTIGQIFNVGYGQSIRFIDMANIIASHASNKIIHIPWPNNYKEIESGDYYTNIHKINHLLSWKPKYNPQLGIQHCFS
jgi:UDP-glucose 4-epimerase